MWKRNCSSLGRRPPERALAVGDEAVHRDAHRVDQHGFKLVAPERRTMIVMKFTMSVTSGSPPSAGKRSYGHCPRRTEISEANCRGSSPSGQRYTRSRPACAYSSRARARALGPLESRVRSALSARAWPRRSYADLGTYGGHFDRCGKECATHEKARHCRASSAPARNRTLNLRIKSPLLCQLSYRGGRRDGSGGVSRPVRGVASCGVARVSGSWPASICS